MINDSFKNRAELCIAQGALTNSKRPQSFVDGVYPTHATWGKGCTIYAGKKAYIDYICGLGSNLLGYGNQVIQLAINAQYARGATLSLSSEIEVECAELLKGLFLFTDLWKFGKNGSDVCSAALKISRAYTGRDLVLSDGYHGCGDDFVSLSSPALGIPRREWIQPLNLDLIKDAACVIVEPVLLDLSKERRAYLQNLRELCTKHGTVLVFDEIITGFRFPKFSVSNHFGIYPDIILLGKAMAGGLPLSAMGGKKEIMNCGEYFYSGTFFGESCSMAACIATIGLLRHNKFNFDLDVLWSAGQIFIDRFNALSKEIMIRGYPTRGSFEGDDLFRALFFQECCKAGVLFGPSFFFSFPHIDHTDIIIQVCRDIISRVKTGQVRLEGKMPVKPFAQKMRGIVYG